MLGKTVTCQYQRLASPVLAVHLNIGLILKFLYRLYRIKSKMGLTNISKGPCKTPYLNQVQGIRAPDSRCRSSSQSNRKGKGWYDWPWPTRNTPSIAQPDARCWPSACPSQLVFCRRCNRFRAKGDPQRFEDGTRRHLISWL